MVEIPCGRRRCNAVLAALGSVAERLERARLKAPPALEGTLAGVARRLADVAALAEDLPDVDPDDREWLCELAGRKLAKAREEVLAAWFAVRASGPWQAGTLLGIVLDELSEAADAFKDEAEDLELDELPEAAE